MMQQQEQHQLDRRGFVATSTAAGVASILAGSPASSLAFAIDPNGATPSKVLVAGSTGQTGSRVFQQLKAYPGVSAVAGARTPSKVKSGTAVKLDVTDPATLGPALAGVDAVICATGFVPGNPFEMQKAAHAVDNVGTIALIDACKAAGVKKFVLVTSILTDAGAWDQRGSVGFKITNAFGGVLDEKIVAEKALRASGLDYTIVRPGGLTANPPTGALQVSAANTLNSGEVSRDTVAAVCIQALFTDKSANKIVEIYENEGADAKAVPKDNWF